MPTNWFYSRIDKITYLICYDIYNLTEYGVIRPWKHRHRKPKMILENISLKQNKNS